MAKQLLNENCYAALRKFSREVQPLHGIANDEAAWCLVMQIEESRRRDRFVRRLTEIKIDYSVADPTSPAFDPIKSSILFIRSGNIEEACWMIFLATYFGRHRLYKWQLSAEVYAGDDNVPWGWERVQNDPKGFDVWIQKYRTICKKNRSATGFGNHRKYESLKRTSAAVLSYIQWVQKFGSHAALISNAQAAHESSGGGFEFIYNSLSEVLSFGRTARFDYLVLLERVGLLNSSPTRPYLVGATGPLEGAHLLISGNSKCNLTTDQIEQTLVKLSKVAGINSDVLEDAICNWQKSPLKFVAFRG